MRRSRGGAAASVPSSLRLSRDVGELSRTRSFFADRRRGAAPVPAARSHDATTRLEVLHAPGVNVAVLSLYVAALVALVYALLAARAASREWRDHGRLARGALWTAAADVVRVGLRAALALLPALFALRLATARRRAVEQGWVAALLLAGLVCVNPLLDEVVREAADRAEWLIVYDATYTVVVYLFLLMSAHSYRVLHPEGYTRAFYLPKIAAVAACFCVKLALGLHYRAVLGLVPFARLWLLVVLERSGRHSARVAVPMLVTTACDSAFAVWIMREVAHTAYFLARVPYLEHRAKQLGFRCFAYQSMVFCFACVGLAFVLLTNLPPAYFYDAYDWALQPGEGEGDRARFVRLEPPVGQLAIAVVYFTWNLILAYVNLPPGPIIPYTMSAMRALGRFLPPALTARHRWPVWLPGHLPYDPHDPHDRETDADGDLADDNHHHLHGEPHEAPTLSLDDASTGTHGTTWRAGIPRGEECPLRYNHRDLHDHGGLGRLLMSPAGAGAHPSPHPPPQPSTYPSPYPFLSMREAGRGDARMLFSCVRGRTRTPSLPSSEPALGRGDESMDLFALDGEVNVLGPPFEMYSSPDRRDSGSATSEFSAVMRRGGSAPLSIPVPREDEGMVGGQSGWADRERDRPLSAPRAVGAPGGGIGSPPGVSFDVRDPSAGGLWLPYSAGSSPFAGSSDAPEASAGPGRLLTRKNLFVMETQVLLANAAYLCYIPGNLNEERPKKLKLQASPSSEIAPASRALSTPVVRNLGSFADGLDELGAQIQSENDARAASGGSSYRTEDENDGLRKMEEGIKPPQYSGRDWELEHDLGTWHDETSPGLRPVSSVPNVAEVDRQPSHDDGTMFLVDPVHLAAQHGYHLYRHIRHDESNGHAIVLVGEDRVVVAFSGTRDAKNWVTNSRFMRAPWDEMFNSFEFMASNAEPSDTDEAHGTGGSDLSASAMLDGGAPPTVPPPGSIESSPNIEGGSATPRLTTPLSSKRHSASVSGLSDSVGNVSGKTPKTSSPARRQPVERTPLLRRSQSDEHLSDRGWIFEHADGDEKGGAARGRAEAGYGSLAGGPPSGRRRLPGRQATRPRRSTRSRSRHRESQLRARHRSSEIEDVANSLAQELVTYGQSKVHLGFAQAYEKLRKRVMGALVELYSGEIGCALSNRGNLEVRATREADRAGCGPKFERDAQGTIFNVEAGSCRGLPLFITGHSLGGVLATFASYECARYFRRIGLRRRQDVACTTFGSPMPGNSVFKVRYTRMVETHWRFEFASDPVSKLPGILNYEPVGVRVLLDQSGMLLVDPSFVEVQWWGRLANPYIGYKLHIRASYLKALKVFCARYKDGEDKLADRFWVFPIACQVGNLFPEC